uniref:ATP synthase F0 subunit 8 n=1 Tax=Acropyga panamensis TaxID=602222 RepID=A0A6G5NI94_9HYME|nr:ATP synthase F0 subunit 8 [Acropyga panamensis]QBG38673.1 ATP synthase F0 subunit 8 [Acropyga panamensis]
MPQMMPMLWIFTYLIIFLILLLIISMMYFLILMPYLQLTFKNFPKYKWIWKW